jgi:hypothetical protein
MHQNAQGLLFAHGEYILLLILPVFIPRCGEETANDMGHSQTFSSFEISNLRLPNPRKT